MRRLQLCRLALATVIASTIAYQGHAQLTINRPQQPKKITPAERKAAAARARIKRAKQSKAAKLAGAGLAAVQGGVPDYFGIYPNWANSPLPRGPIDPATVAVTDGGSGYTAATTLTVEDVYGTGSGATATFTLANGSVASVTLTNPGTNYTAPMFVFRDCPVDPTLPCNGAGALVQAQITPVAGGIRKFIDTLPGLGFAARNNLGQYIPVAVPDTTTYPGSDYYEIELGQYTERMHTDLPSGALATVLRGYRQTNHPLNDPNVEAFHQLGPMIVATKNRPVRIKFTNSLAGDAAGKLFVPVDLTVLGAGPGPTVWQGLPGQRGDVLCQTPFTMATRPGCYTENRATLHLHGGHTPWISDGTPHQWITPALDSTQLKMGASVINVPDMPDPGPGSQTFYWTNQQSARLMFYHDHAWGLTRLNVYVGEAAGYLITDEMENALVNGGTVAGRTYQPGTIPGAADTIPLIIQDKTFVDAATILKTDPTWNSGTGALDASGSIRAPKTGDLWWPHVYMPAQNPYDLTGTAAMGRWHYGPWFWPPTTGIAYGPVPNPLYNANDPNSTQPPENPGTPNVSWGAEAFLDTPAVNGTVYPTLTIQPKPYRLRILNAAHDRFWNLQLYEAVDATGAVSPNGMDVRMLPASPGTGLPPDWPVDGREGGVPDPALKGPDFIQIGTEGGFLPAPAIVPTRPIAWNLNPTTFNFGNVSDHALLLGPAERADVIVDFSAYAGRTLILYNDAPTAFPALDPRTDYYTGKPDHSLGGDGSGGSPTTYYGYGPNTRTIMQIKVVGTPAPAFNLGRLQQAFASDAATPGVFKAGQDPVLVAQAPYNSAYASSFPTAWPYWGYSRIQDTSMQVRTLDGRTVLIPFQPKAIQDEMGEAFDEFGRMSAKLGLELPFTQAGNQNFVLQNYVDPVTEILTDAREPGMPQTAADGTQIWKITHNGVDTHPVHFHLFDVQLLNRVGWDGAIRVPDPNELGWKDTVRISPLEDTIVALRPVAPRQPFGVPNSQRLLNPALPLNSAEGFTNIDPLTGQPITPVVRNTIFNFGWEYVWHCHILSHEEMDMMRPMKLNVTSTLPVAPQLSVSAPGGVVTLAWTDGTPFNPLSPTAYSWANLGRPDSEVGFRIERATVTNGVPGSYALVGTALANKTSFADAAASATGSYNYRVTAFNAAGSSVSNIAALNPAATFTVAPVALTFQSALNVTSAPQTAQITNTGTTAISLTGITLGGTDASQFARTYNCPASLPAGQSCTASVTFRPTTGTPGTKSALLSIAFAGAAARTVSLTGTVTASTGAVLTVAPTAVNFGNLAVGVQRSQTVVVSNTGTASLTLTPAVLGGTNASDFSQQASVAGGCMVNGVWRTLAPQTSCQIAVRFRPRSVGPKSATLTVNAAAPATPASVVVTLTGNGI